MRESVLRLIASCARRVLEWAEREELAALAGETFVARLHREFDGRRLTRAKLRLVLSLVASRRSA